MYYIRVYIYIDLSYWKSRPNMPACSALQDPFLMGQLGLAWTKGLQEGEDKRFIQVRLNGTWWEITMDIYGYLWVYIYGTSLGNDVEKAMEMAIDSCWYRSISAFGQRFFDVRHGFLHDFSIGSSREKGGISWGSIAASPQSGWVTQVKAGNHKGFKWFKWVCLKIGYILNYSHLVGIMISKTIWVQWGTLFSDTPK